MQHITVELPADAFSGRDRKALRSPDQHGNRTAHEGASRCECGCKYWESDRCIDCGTQHDPARHDSDPGT